MANLHFVREDVEPMIRCPGCSSWVPLARHVLVLGETVTLDCPVCRGARDLVFDRAMN